MMVTATISLRLRQAILLNDLTLVERLLKNNAHLLFNPDFNNKSNTSLHYAAQAGHVEIAKFLISSGHDHTAEVTDYIFTSAGNNQGISVNTDGQCALHIAAARHHGDLIELLCEHFPYTVNRRDKNGQTPLLLATVGVNAASAPLVKRPSSASTDDLRALETLLKYGADVLTQDNEGNSCLHVACAWGNLKAARALVQAGADPLCRNYAGWTPDAYSLTVQADVYYRTLVAEFEKRRAEEAARAHERRRTGGGGRVRLVDSADDDDESDSGAAASARSRAGTHSTQRTDRSDSLGNYHNMPGGLGISVNR